MGKLNKLQEIQEIHQRGLYCTWTTGAYDAHVLFMSTPQGPQLHLKVSVLQRPLLHLDVSTPQGA
jgi:hypothetical protein